MKLIFCIVVVTILIDNATPDPWLPGDEIEVSVKTMTTSQLKQALMKAVNKKSNPVLYKLAQMWGPVCNSNNRNQVLARTERNQIPHETRTPPWTVAVEALRFSQAMKSLKSSGGKSCASIDSFLQSVASGSRLCPLHLLSPKEICNTLHEYSHVYWVGDSLTRHTIMALLSLVTSNLQMGAVPRSFEGNEHFPFNDCQCDGMYSEAGSCRLYNQSSFSSAVRQACRRYIQPPTLDTVFHYVYHSDGLLPGLSRCLPADKRPVALLYQGGRMGDASAEDRQRLWPVVSQLCNFTRKCCYQVSPEFAAICGDSTSVARRDGRGWPHTQQGTYRSTDIKRVHLAFTGGNVQARRFDGVFFKQSREVFQANNEAWRRYMAVRYPGMVFLDFFNLTYQPPAESSDGYHYLTATNIEKANAIFRLMALWRREDRAASRSLMRRDE